MTLDSLMLFVHVVLAMLLFVLSAIGRLGRFQMRNANDVQTLRLWGRMLHRVEPLMGPGGALLFLSGAYLVGQGFRWADGWVVTAIGGIVAIEVLGGTVMRASGKRLGMAVAQAPDGPVSDELRTLIAAPAAWIVGHAIDGIAIGVLYLMAAKPSTVTSVLVVTGAAVLGGLTALPFVGRRTDRRVAAASA